MAQAVPRLPPLWPTHRIRTTLVLRLSRGDGSQLKIGIASADYLRADRNPAGVEAWGGSGWARVGQYVDYYRTAGHEVMAGTMWQHDGEILIEDAENKIMRPDIVVMQRMMHKGIDRAIKLAQGAGQIIVNDVDDWYWGLDPNNQAFNASHPNRKQLVPDTDAFGNERKDMFGKTIMKEVANDENVNNYAKNLAASDLLVVSTPYLADRISQRIKRPIVTIPNYIDVSRFTPVVQSTGAPTFGWAGSTGHRSGDLETVAGVFRRPIQEGMIKFQHSGDHFSSAPLSSLMGIDDDLIIKVPRCTAEDYPSILTFDVGIVPLRDTPFNHAKSDIKGLEYAASGIPFIAQNLSAYKALAKDWNGAFWIADRANDWVRGIKKHLDRQYRLERQQELLELVQDRDIAHGAGEWVSLLESL